MPPIDPWLKAFQEKRGHKDVSLRNELEMNLAIKNVVCNTR